MKKWNEIQKERRTKIVKEYNRLLVSKKNAPTPKEAYLIIFEKYHISRASLYNWKHTAEDEKN